MKYGKVEETLVGTVKKSSTADYTVQVENIETKGILIDIRLLTKSSNRLNQRLTKVGLAINEESSMIYLKISNSRRTIRT